MMREVEMQVKGFGGPVADSTGGVFGAVMVIFTISVGGVVAEIGRSGESRPAGVDGDPLLQPAEAAGCDGSVG
jgi:hypothetical protein